MLLGPQPHIRRPHLRELHQVDRALQLAHVVALEHLAQLARLRLERRDVRQRGLHGLERIAAVRARPRLRRWDVVGRAELADERSERGMPLAEGGELWRRGEDRVRGAGREERRERATALLYKLRIKTA